MKSHCKVLFSLLLILNLNQIFASDSNEEIELVLLSELELEHETIERQADQPSSNEDFIAIHKDAVGTVEQLSPDMRSLAAMAIMFLPSNHKFNNVIEATREIVAGVKFNILVNAVDDNGTEIVCFLDILEKPWIVTEFGQKLRILKYTNCTEDGNDYVPSPVDESSYQVNKMFQKKETHMTEEGLLDLENQILGIPNENLADTSKNVFSSQSASIVPEETVSRKDVNQVAAARPETDPNKLQQDIQLAIEHIFQTNEDIKRALEEIASNSDIKQVQERYESVFEQLVQVVVRSIFNHTESINDTFSYEFPIQFNHKKQPSRVQGAIIYVEKEVETSTETSSTTTTTDTPVTSTASEVLDQSTVQLLLETDIDNNSTEQLTESPQVELERPKREINTGPSKTIESKNVVHLKEQLAIKVSEQVCATCYGSHDNHIKHDCVKLCIKLGGKTELPDNHPKAVELAKKAVSEKVTEDNSKCEFSHLSNVRKQIVAGTKYFATVHHKCNDQNIACEIEMWTPPGKSTKFKWACPIDKVGRSKRAFPGARFAIKNRTEVEILAKQEVAKQIFTGDNTPHVYVELIDGEEQIVQGSLYDINVRTKCGGKTCICHMKIWYQPWVEKVETKEFTCSDERTRRNSPPPPGAPSAAENDPEAERLARQAVSEIATGDDSKCEFKRIENVRKQVVAGMKYFGTVHHVCGGQDIACEIEMWSQPWKKFTKFDWKCPEGTVGRSKRETKEPPTLGGIDAAPGEGHVQEAENLAKKAVSEIATGDGSKCEFKRIENVRSQVVSGTKYFGTVHHVCGGQDIACEIEMWSQPWKKFTKFTWKCPEGTVGRSKRDTPPPPGGIVPAEGHDQEAENLAKKAVSEIATGDGSKCEFKRIENVRKQVVAGMKYFGTVHHVCGGQDIACEIEMWSQPWKKFTKFDWKCPEGTVGRSRREAPEGLVGGLTPVEEVDPEAEKLARKAVSEIPTGDGPKCEFSHLKNVRRQIVAGIKYYATVHHACGDEKKACEIEMWSQPWRNFTKFDWKCTERKRRESGHHKHKDMLVGNNIPIDKSEFEKLERMVTDALDFASTQDPNNNYNFVKIKSATKQVVSGISYHFDVETKDDDDNPIHCSMRVWSQPWKREGDNVKITCNNQTFKFRLQRSTHETVREHHHREHPLYTTKGEEHMKKLFNRFVAKHNRNYNEEEHETRYRIFKGNLFKIEQLNRNEQGTARYGITEFADLTTAEYKQRTGLVVPKRDNDLKNPMADILDLELPKEYDWRKKNVVSEVKNQGSCGSCWAFSAVGNIEGQHAIKYGNLESYSEQELLDCDTVDNACGGGYMDDAFKAIEKIGGIELESEYPYDAKKEKCQFNPNKVHARVKGAVDLPKNETAIAQFLVQNGPIAVALNANAMQFYRGGVSKPWKLLCSPKNLDHGVLLVGYGVSEYPKFNKTLPYWIIKNSWGQRWGEQGYYRLYRGDNRCGISEMASSAVIE